MITISPLAKKLSGYLLVGPIWALAVVLSTFEKDGLPRWTWLSMFVLGYFVIAVVTFDWGRLRGFALNDEQGRFSSTNVLRCLVMTCIMVAPVSLVAFPLMYWAARLVR